MSSNVTSEVIDILLSRAVAETLLSLDQYEAIDKDALFHLNQLTEQFLQMLLHRILACTRVKRRTRASYEDVELALLREHISTGALETELTRVAGSQCKRAASPVLEVCADKIPKRFESAMDRKLQAQLLGPELNGKRRGIPPYMMEKGMLLPALPPLYTHQKTAVFPDRVDSELEMRQRVLQETQLVEASLWRLADMEEQAIHKQLVGNGELDTVMQDADISGNDSSGDDDQDRPTNVMSRTAIRQMARRKRLEAFSQVWKDMSFGELVRHRPTNVDTIKHAGKV
ncbi:hypothetical protein BCR37DRAFT_404941 [Protomyces lactucae-debilis]|uniref:Transcription initiation factor TFIID subunit 8 n=1 Tax=Protomyces lactucae-debilis TaxID=2754530 RepID=A0A1Y2FB01_PROLT|nr:uncharacterized protein BCR37DRAFT_404941 [Protomyces lactucae-debilis]ORY80516.1 hypothetical protein BCR37DRAFT_404941 [Protomyces lactucae-debilis]